MSIPPRIEQIKAMLEKEPNDTFLNYALATEYMALDEIDKAQTLFEKLTRDQPDYVATYYHLGKLYESTGKETKAEEMYKVGIQKAMAAKDTRTRAELTEALNDLLFADD